MGGWICLGSCTMGQWLPPPNIRAPTTVKNRLVINCKICDEGVLEKNSVYRRGKFSVRVGYLIYIPAVFLLLSLALNTSWPAEYFGVRVKEFLFMEGGWILIPVAFVGILIGWLLTRRKKILKCSCCGAVVAAS
jgi:hypothetical protein